MVRYDPATGLCDAVAAGEDAYEAEPAIALRLLGQALPDELYVADRAYCLGHIFGTLAERKAFYLVREHRGRIRTEALGRLVRRGRCATGTLSEQPVVVHDAHRGVTHRARRIVLRLDRPTEGGESEVVFLTNLPPEVPAAAWRTCTAGGGGSSGSSPS